jgi:GTP-binding protein HflX
VSVSAVSGAGIELFLHALSDRLRALSRVVELLIPYDRGDLLAAVHREGEVLSTHHDDDGVRVCARLADASVGRLAQFVVATA